MPDEALTEIGPAGAAELARFAAALWRGLPGWPQTPGEAEARMRLLLGAGYRAFLLRMGEAAAAYALTRDNGDHVFIRHFVVAEGWTRKGLGTRLFRGLDERFDHPEFRVSVQTENGHLTGFWIRMGFAPDAVNLARPPAPEED
jgi:GNAT superfamily N-acetyltransferase